MCGLRSTALKVLVSSLRDAASSALARTVFLNLIGKNSFLDKMTKTVHSLVVRKLVPSLPFNFSAVTHP